jgi:hypothetical protein
MSSLGFEQAAKHIEQCGEDGELIGREISINGWILTPFNKKFLSITRPSKLTADPGNHFEVIAGVLPVTLRIPYMSCKTGGNSTSCDNFAYQRVLKAYCGIDLNASRSLAYLQLRPAVKWTSAKFNRV